MPNPTPSAMRRRGITPVNDRFYRWLMVSGWIAISLWPTLLEAKPIKLRRARGVGRGAPAASFTAPPVNALPIRAVAGADSDEARVPPSPEEFEAVRPETISPAGTAMPLGQSPPPVEPDPTFPPDMSTEPITTTTDATCSNGPIRVFPTYGYHPLAWWLSSCGGPGVKPLGLSIQCPMETQIANGHAARLALFHYDFVNDSARDMSALNDAGLRKLRRLLPTFQSTGFPLTIQRVPDQEDLSERRRWHVRERISALAGFPISDQRVVLADVPGGLYGEEAIFIHQTMLGVTRSAGSSGGGASWQGSGTSSGQGFGQGLGGGSGGFGSGSSGGGP